MFSVVGAKQFLVRWTEIATETTPTNNNYLYMRKIMLVCLKATFILQRKIVNVFVLARDFVETSR